MEKELILYTKTLSNGDTIRAYKIKETDELIESNRGLDDPISSIIEGTFMDVFSKEDNNNDINKKGSD